MKTNRILSGLLVVLMAIGLGFFSVTNASAHEKDGKYSLSRSQFNEYCAEQGYERGVKKVGNNAYGLRCVDRYGTPVDIQVDDVCASAYPDLEYPVSRLLTMAGTYAAWQCIDTVGYAGVPDLEGWCDSKYEGAEVVQVGHPDGYLAYGLRCSPHVDFTMTEVCKWLYGPNAIDRVYDVRSEDISTWECYYVRKT